VNSVVIVSTTWTQSLTAAPDACCSIFLNSSSSSGRCAWTSHYTPESIVWSSQCMGETNLRFETLSALPEGGGCCLRRIWREKT